MRARQEGRSRPARDPEAPEAPQALHPARPRQQTARRRQQRDGLQVHARAHPRHRAGRVGRRPDRAGRRRRRMSAGSGGPDSPLREPGRPLRERTEVLLRGRIFDLVASELTLPSGIEQSVWVVEHPGAVAIVPVTEQGELVLVRQYRHAARDVLIEIPAGRLDRGEAPLAAARRELAEETGMSASDWRELVTFLPAPGFCSERIVLFEARGLESIAHRADAARPDADEDIEVLRMRPERVLEVARDAKTLLAAAWVLLGR